MPLTNEIQNLLLALSPGGLLQNAKYSKASGIQRSRVCVRVCLLKISKISCGFCLPKRAWQKAKTNCLPRSVLSFNLLAFAVESTFLQLLPRVCLISHACKHLGSHMRA
jgi:hypothetical protein